MAETASSLHSSKDIKIYNSSAPMDTQPVASAASTAAHSNATNINNSTAAVASALVNSAVAAAPLNTTGGPQSSNTGETVTAETGEDTMRKQKLVEEFQYLLEKSQSLFSGLRDLPPTGSHRQWRPYFEKTFEVYTKLWKFQQTHRSILEDKSNYGLKRWEVGEIASKIGQLYYHYYLRTSETNYLYEAYVFYEAIHERQYFKDIIEVKNSALMIKKMRYYARFIIVCLLLNKDENVRQLIAELEQLIEEYTKSFKPPDAKEWQMVLEEIRTFTEAEKKLVPINLDRTPDKIQHRLAPDLAERSLGNLPKLRLQEAILVGSYQKQIKFSELTLDMYRMLQSLERKPYIIHPSVAANAPHQKKPNEDKEKKDTAIKEDGTVKNNTTAHTTNASISSNPMASVANTSSSSTAANTVTNAANATTTTNASNASNASTVIPSNTVATNNSTNSVNNTGAADSISAAATTTATTTTTAATANNAANNNTNNASVTASNAVPSISTSAPTNASATHGLTSQVQNERNAKRSNPHKYLLYRPSLTQLLVYISTAFKDTGDHAALLLYLSADGYAYPERTVPGYGGGVLTSQRSKQTTDRSNTGPAALSNIANSTAAATNTTSMNTSSLNHAANNTLGAGVNTSSTQAASSANTNTINTNGVVGGTVTNSNNTNNPNQANAATSVTNASMSHAIETATIPPSVHCLHPADLIPFTRKPLFLIVDSDNSVEFKSMPNVFDQPVMCLMSPVEYPSSVQDKSEIGSLFTLFLHTPLLGFCSVSDIGNLDQSKWDECVRKIAAMEKLIGDLLISDVNVDKNIKRFMSDDFLYCFIVRFVLCGIFLRYHSSFKDEKAFPSSVPSVPESIYVSTEIVTMLGDLTAIADVGTYFSLPAYASSSTPTTAAALINTTNANVLSSSPTSTMATLVDTTNTKE